jgi:hypothetical protein
MLGDGLNGEFGGAAVEETNGLLEGWVELPRAMVMRCCMVLLESPHLWERSGSSLLWDWDA